MKKIFFTIFCFALWANSYGQKTEFSIAFNSGLFSFAGQSAEKETFINYNSVKNSSCANNPYGAENGLCYGLSANIKRVNKNNFVFGFDIGYEILRSKIQVNSVVDYSGMVNYTFDASGQTFLNSNCINLNPQIGYRLSVKQVSIDLLTGFDVAFCLNATEKGKTTTTNGTEFSSSIDRKTINSDIRLRFQVSTGFKKMGAYIGYSLGLANYKSGYVGGVNECYARLFRFGLTYQIK